VRTRNKKHGGEERRIFEEEEAFKKVRIYSSFKVSPRLRE
jgi:hypothetical protein